MDSGKEDLVGRHVIVGISGGVDSAAAALLLQQRGAHVEALHMTNWDDRDGYCTAAEDLQDARAVCGCLDITLHHVNFAAEYRDRVFRYFLDEYRRGRTPNPDVLCNREIKFGVFLEYALRLGGEFIATGHYAQIDRRDGRTSLLRGVDPGKDQSYFLHAVDEQALAQTLFPLGGLRKSAVRRLALDRGLPVAAKKDSTGICFIGERPFREFLATFLPASPGPMKTPDGRIVGEHQGLMYYTHGQRQGLGIGGLRDTAGDPWYVASKDIADNALIVVQGEHPLRYSMALSAGSPSWINGPPPALENGNAYACTVQTRYRQADRPCRVAARGDELLVMFDERQADVTPGQFAVFYAGDRCLGGAVIEHSHRSADALRKAG